MANGPLNVDTAFVVHLRSYGFFHSGRERLRVQVLKRVWEHIPGSTLYGAVAAALIRLDGIDEHAEPFEEGDGAYHRLMGAVREQAVRFTSLLPADADHPLKSAGTYCQQALRLHAALYADNAPESLEASEGVEASGDWTRSILHTGPHAPLNRDTERIHGDQVFVLRTHRPMLDYYGFIFAKENLRPLLERAFRLFPLMPVGGRGKFSLVEAEIVDQASVEEFRDNLRHWVGQDERTGWVRLLTPLVLRNGQPDDLLKGNGREIVMDGLRRYRVWRTGRYYDAYRDDGDGGFADPRGIEKGEREAASAFLPGGRESDAVLAVPEHSRFRLLDGDDVADWFITGVGNPNWTYLGWGQVVIE
jgi:hypothetical protein